MDLAGKNIAKILIEKFDFKKTKFATYKKGDITLYACKESVLFMDPSDEFQPDLCVVASRHKSESGRPTLSAHPTGNWGKAEMGGKDKELAIAPALYLRESLLLLQKLRIEKNLDYGYDVSLEVTHHGPTLNFPLLFVEVGSTENQWKDKIACEVVASTIYEILMKEIKSIPTAIGFGGPHYAPNFTKLILNKEIAVGHIAPKYAIDLLDESMIRQMIDKTIPRPKIAILDWKGLKKEQRSKIIGILDDIGMEWKKVKDF